MEKVIETKSCKHCGVKFDITDKDLEFYEKVSLVFDSKKYIISTPNFCPDCRVQRRMSWRNERNLYKRECNATGKQIISIYSPDKNNVVYDQDFWFSDKWNPLDYGVDFDFSRTFFSQISDLINKVPLLGFYNLDAENSRYNCWSIGLKNCYLMSGANNNEFCSYGNYMNNNVWCVDNLMTHFSENCYNCVDCTGCYKLFFGNYSQKCRNSYFLHNCSDCDFCIGCSNLNSKKYFLFNEQISKEDYEELIVKLSNYSFLEEFREKYLVFLEKQIKRSIYGNGNEEVYGNNIYNSKNCFSCFDVTGLEDCKYCTWLHDSKTCYDVFSWGKPSELLYESVATGDRSTSIAFSFQIQNSSNIFYSLLGIHSDNLFGCVGLKNKSYCILNKQYTKEEYNKLVPKIIEHMQKTGERGEFFPSSLSPFGYNETVASEQYHINKEEVLSLGFNWSDYESPKPKVDKIIREDQLPEDIKDIPDDILNWAIECEVTKKPFRIIREELEFYRKHNLPIPRRHPDQRHLDRMKLRNPRKLYDRKCDKCGVDIKTTYSPKRPEIVYCEECYNKEVY